MEISNYPTLSGSEVSPDQSLCLIADENGSFYSSGVDVLLGLRSFSKSPKYFVRSIHLDQEPRRKKLNFAASFNQDNLLSTDSKFLCKVDFFATLSSGFNYGSNSYLNQMKTCTLPSFYLSKNHGSGDLTVFNFNDKYSVNIGSSENVILSRIYANNQYYNIRSLISTTSDSINFSYISYTQAQIFDTRINFVIESYS